MKLSIIMLVYNHERFIAQALESVLMQKTDFEYELIIGEDCSSDGSREIIRSYEKRFEGKMKPLYRDKNLGMAGNLMDCLERCTGQYIAVLEGDDFWTDDQKLQKQAAFLDEHPEYVMVVHNWNIVSGSGAFIEKGSNSREFKKFGKEDLQRYGLPAQTSTIFVRNIAGDLKEKYNIEVPKELQNYIIEFNGGMPEPYCFDTNNRKGCVFHSLFSYNKEDNFNIFFIWLSCRYDKGKGEFL